MKKKVSVLFLSLLFCLLLPLPASANAAEPPRLSVMVLNPPEGLRLSETGKSARVPLAFYRASAERPAAAAPDAFDWTQPYIPEAGWLD